MQSPETPSGQSSEKKTKKKTKSMMGAVKAEEGSNKKESSGKKTKKRTKSVMGVVNMNDYGKSPSQENSKKTKKGKSLMKAVSEYSKLEDGSKEKDYSTEKGKTGDKSLMVNMSEYGKVPSAENSKKSDKTKKGNGAKSVMGGVSQFGKVTGSGEVTDDEAKKETPEGTVKKKEGSDETAEVPKVPIPKTYFNTVDVEFDLEKQVRPSEIVFSYTMVVRSINRFSPLMRFLLVGDQVINVNGRIPYTSDDFLCFVTPGKVKMTVVRPWNVHHCDSRLPEKCKKDTNYVVVDVHRGISKNNGFEIKFANKKTVVTKVKAASRGGHAFVAKDRILDIDSQNADGMDSQDLRKKFTTMMKEQGKCSFLVERAPTLKSSTNPSLTTARAANRHPIVMGDDACEIGAREATRILRGKQQYKRKSILTENDYPAPSTIQTEASSDDSRKSSMKSLKRGSKKGSRKGKRKKTKKKNSNGRSISIDSKNETFRMPSDVKDPASLQKVTQESGIISFVRSRFWR